jgi:aryl-alcohol dehydrogenase-like predicted oxidoreductase
MQFVELGASGLRVSRVGVGTAAFGLEHYGIPTPGEEAVGAAKAMATIRAAADGGVNVFDTAPGYGAGEEILGEALARYPDCIVATKIPVPDGLASMPAQEVARKVNASLDNSRRALRREVLDVVQIHNATKVVLASDPWMDSLERARDDGKVRWLGASVYGAGTALAAIRTGKIQVLQLAVSVLDQQMCHQVLPEAARMGVGVLTRSALLKGALTKRARWLPESLRPVGEASARVVAALNTSWDELPTIALRFCLSLRAAQTVLVGIRSTAELQECLKAEAAGPLPPNLMEIAHSLALNGEQLVNPSFWRLDEGDTKEKLP